MRKFSNKKTVYKAANQRVTKKGPSYQLAKAIRVYFVEHNMLNAENKVTWIHQALKLSKSDRELLEFMVKAKRRSWGPDEFIHKDKEEGDSYIPSSAKLYLKKIGGKYRFMVDVGPALVMKKIGRSEIPFLEPRTGFLSKVKFAKRSKLLLRTLHTVEKKLSDELGVKSVVKNPMRALSMDIGSGGKKRMEENLSSIRRRILKHKKETEKWESMIEDIDFVRENKIKDRYEDEDKKIYYEEIEDLEEQTSKDFRNKPFAEWTDDEFYYWFVKTDMQRLRNPHLFDISEIKEAENFFATNPDGSLKVGRAEWLVLKQRIRQAQIRWYRTRNRLGGMNLDVKMLLDNENNLGILGGLIAGKYWDLMEKHRQRLIVVYQRAYENTSKEGRDIMKEKPKSDLTVTQTLEKYRDWYRGCEALGIIVPELDIDDEDK